MCTLSERFACLHSYSYHGGGTVYSYTGIYSYRIPYNKIIIFILYVRGTGLVKPAARSRDSDFPTCATDSLTPYN